MNNIKSDIEAIERRIMQIQQRIACGVPSYVEDYFNDELEELEKQKQELLRKEKINK